MGFKRVLGSGIVGMLLLVPFAWISFRFLNLTSEVTNGLIQNLEEIDLSGLLGAGGGVITFLFGALVGLFMVCFFPIHWALQYRPEDIGLLIALATPWILTGAISSALFAHSPRGGLHTSLAVGIGYFILMLLPYFAIGALMAQAGLGGAGTALFNGLTSGLTDLPYIAAIFLATMEGALLGGVFGAFIGSLKYKPEGVSSSGKKSSSSSFSEEEPSFSDFDSTPPTAPKGGADFCTNCGAKLTPDDMFCTNCGAKR